MIKVPKAIPQEILAMVSLDPFILSCKIAAYRSSTEVDIQSLYG